MNFAVPSVCKRKGTKTGVIRTGSILVGTAFRHQATELQPETLHSKPSTSEPSAVFVSGSPVRVRAQLHRPFVSSP